MKSAIAKLSAIISFALLAALALFAAPLFLRSFAEEAEEPVAELTPVTDCVSPAYHYFSSPISIYADAAGILVAGDTGIDAVSFDGAVTPKRDTPADKAISHGDLLVTLYNGTIVAYYGDATSTFDGFEVSDFDIEGDVLYAVGESNFVTIPIAETAIDTSSAVAVTLERDSSATVNATRVTVCSGTAYLAIDSELFRNRQDICTVDGNRLKCVLYSVDEALSLASVDSTGTVYALTRDKVTAYVLSGGGLIERYCARDASLTCIYGGDGALYGLNTLDGVCKISYDLSVFTTIVASADGAHGFFDLPSAAAVKNSVMYVADTLNDRVAMYGSELTYFEKDFIAPVSVASDSTGALYVAHSYNKVDIFDSNLEKTSSVAIEGVISQIAVNADKELFILSDSGLWVKRQNADPVHYPDSSFKAIALSAGRDDLYALTQTNVVKLNAGDALTQTVHCPADPATVSFAVDLDGTVFALSKTYLRKTVVSDSVQSVDYRLCAGSAPYSLGADKGHVILSTVQNKFIGYNAIVIVDSHKHRVFTADGKALGAKLIDDDYYVPDIVDDDYPGYYGEGLIRVALYDTPVFDKPMETPSSYTIAKDRKVIVPQYELEDSKEYSLILIDNLATGKLIQGYVYKNSLSDPLPYEAPPAEVGTVYSNATPVYKWPSPNSEIVRGFGALERQTQFEMLDFVKSYHDDYDNLWYRIRISDLYEGYILASNLSVLDYEPIFIRPAYNAEVVSYNGSSSAQAYELRDGVYTPIDVFFPTGTQLEVVGAFDTSEHYTEVKYLDPDLGTLTCYVETVYLKYNGTNIVLIVAIIVIVITVILAAIIIGRMVYLKRKRLMPSPADKDEAVGNGNGENTIDNDDSEK